MLFYAFPDKRFGQFQGKAGTKKKKVIKTRECMQMIPSLSDLCVCVCVCTGWTRI